MQIMLMNMLKSIIHIPKSIMPTKAILMTNKAMMSIVTLMMPILMTNIAMMSIVTLMMPTLMANKAMMSMVTLMARVYPSLSSRQ
jgi:hypothetical protein